MPGPHSVKNEPFMRADAWKSDPSETLEPPRKDERDEAQRIDDSVWNEPAQGGTLPGGASYANFADWLARKRQGTALTDNMAACVAAMVAGGVFATLGAMLAYWVAGQGSNLAVYTIAIFAPVAEEMLKQSGGIFLLEKAPYRIKGGWIFPMIGLGSGLIFSVLENLLYLYAYIDPEDVADHATFAAFRWTVCTALHMGCSLIAGMGLRRVWTQTVQTGKKANLEYAYPLFATAMAIHGTYNLVALGFDFIFKPY